jgi:hypothetical protein
MIRKPRRPFGLFQLRFAGGVEGRQTAFSRPKVVAEVEQEVAAWCGEQLCDGSV